MNNQHLNFLDPPNPPPPRQQSRPKPPGYKVDPVQAILNWQQDPVLFVEQAMNVEFIEDWQKIALQNLLVPSDQAIRSGHGVGKSAFLAWAIIYWMLLKPEPRIACTAPTGHQLEDVLWGEIAQWTKRLPQVLQQELNVKNERIEATRNPKQFYCVARTARKDQPEAFQGFHAPDMLFIADEASGVDDIIFQVGEGAMSTKGAKTILTGNPTRTSGYFYDAFHKMRSTWIIQVVSCLEIKRPGHSEEYGPKMAKKYGEDSNIYRVRVLGEFPAVDDDAVISLQLCEEATRRDVGQVPGTIVWGLDVARFGDDTSALAKRQRNVLLEPTREWKGKDIMQTAGIVYNEYNETRPALRPSVIMVDEIGLGAGVLDRLKELGLPARGVNVAESPAVKEKFLRLRDELWWSAREWLEARDCKIPEDDDLIGELTSPKYQFTSAGKIQIESKLDMKKRGVASPNKADAFIMTFAASDFVNKWTKPLNYPKTRWV